MDFTKAMEIMEKGGSVKGPLWAGYLFLDIDGNVKHAGMISCHEMHWKLNIHKTDWEINYMPTTTDNTPRNTIMDKEISTARMEALMDQNSAHIKRMYYLEDMIEDHHKSVKRLVDAMNNEMEDTRKALYGMAKLMPIMKDSMASMKDLMKSLAVNYHGIKSQQIDNKELIRRVNKLLKELHLEEEVKVGLEQLKATPSGESIKLNSEEEGYMIVVGSLEEEDTKPQKPKRKPSYKLPKSKTV